VLKRAHSSSNCFPGIGVWL